MHGQHTFDEIRTLLESRVAILVNAVYVADATIILHRRCVGECGTRSFFKPTYYPRIEIKSRKKISSNNDDLTQRVISPEETLSRMKPVCDKIGITRISDITGLDRLGIPNYTVTLPGTEDSIWVYSGKGQTKSDAKASALMEAVERFSSLSATKAYQG